MKISRISKILKREKKITKANLSKLAQCLGVVINSKLTKNESINLILLNQKNNKTKLLNCLFEIERYIIWDSQSDKNNSSKSRNLSPTLTLHSLMERFLTIPEIDSIIQNLYIGRSFTNKNKAEKISLLIQSINNNNLEGEFFKELNSIKFYVNWGAYFNDKVSKDLFDLETENAEIKAMTQFDNDQREKELNDLLPDPFNIESNQEIIPPNRLKITDEIIKSVFTIIPDPKSRFYKKNTNE